MYIYNICVCVCVTVERRTKKKKVAVVTAGVVVFNFGAPVKKGHGGGSDSTYGLALIAFSLFLDGLTGGLQDRVKATTIEMNPDKKNAGITNSPRASASFKSMWLHMYLNRHSCT